MAAAGTAAGGGPYRRVVLAILTISVVLNVFFVAGFAWTRMEVPRQSRSFEKRLQRIAAELDLDARQRAGFEQFVAATRARSEGMQRQITPLLATAWAEAAKPQAEPTEVLRLFEEVLDKRRQSQRETIAQTLDFLSTLTPEQRGEFVALARERRGPWRSSPAQNR